MANPEPDAPLAADVDALADASVCTVADLNDDIADVVETSDALYFDYVVGDVTDYRDVNGHVHFDLDEDDASLHCVVFGSRRGGLPEDLTAGTRVAVAGDLSVYEAQGSCSILVTDVVDLGDGSYRQEYRQNREALAEAGLFDDEHKQALPAYPTRVGVVTSADSDAREDAVTSIHDRHPGIDVVVQHATVQGDTALESLLGSVSALDRDPDVDLLVVTRGGGADTTLRVFNEPALCRVVFETDTPIVVGVGHERDTALVEAVADERVMTPTDVGSVVPDRATLQEETERLSTALADAAERHAKRRVADAAVALDDAGQRHARDVLTAANSDLDRAVTSLARERLTDLDGRLDHAVAAVEQRTEHEAAKAKATAAVAAEYERRQRRYRAAIVALVVLDLLLLAYLLVGP
jgi:exodeoxyribonuclease VII large subunit